MTQNKKDDILNEAADVFCKTVQELYESPGIIISVTNLDKLPDEENGINIEHPFGRYTGSLLSMYAAAMMGLGHQIGAMLSSEFSPDPAEALQPNSMMDMGASMLASSCLEMEPDRPEYIAEFLEGFGEALKYYAAQIRESIQ